MAFGKITIWTSNENVKDAIIDATKGFVKEYQTKVDVIVLNKDLTSQFKTAAIANKGPDIFAWAHDVIGELVESGLIEPLKISKKLKSEFFPVALDAFTYKGKIYGYPYDVEAIALIYNKKLVKTPPKSIKELLITAKKIEKKNKGTYGFLYDYNGLFFSFPFFSAGGGYIFKNKDGTLDIHDIGISHKGTIAGARLLRKFVKDGHIPESTNRSIAFEQMKKGKLGMTIDGPWALKDLRKSGIDYGISVIPTFNGKTPRPFVGVHGFIIRRSSKNKDLAKELIENYLVNKSGALKLYKADPRGPSRKDVLAELKSDKDLQAFVESAKNGIPMPNVPAMSAVWSSVGSALQQIIQGKKDAAVALKTAQKQILSTLKKK